MKDVLGNPVTNFVQFSPPSVKTKDSLSRYYHQVLVDESKRTVAIRVVNSKGDLLGWNIVLRSSL